jgi:transcriptional regulator with XRE-family HTH domain
VADNELGLFLRSRREAVTPAEAGLPTGGRRRTPGLRRSELAALAGVSVEYVTRLEQGRDRHPSPSVLSALAGALRLATTERFLLYRLSKGADSGFTCRAATAGPAREVRPGLRALVDRLDPAAAVVLNAQGDLLAWTPAFARLAAPTGLLDGDPPNLPRYVFTDQRARTTFPDWDRVADERVAELKQGPFRADPHLAVLADELTVAAGEAFDRRVRTVPGMATAHGVQRWRHPRAGDLRMAYETLDLPADDAQHLVVHLPADQATAAALAGLAPALHLVSA